MEPLDTHISRQYNAELEDIRTRVLHMGGLVEQQIALAIGVAAELQPLVEFQMMGQQRAAAIRTDDPRRTREMAGRT